MDATPFSHALLNRADGQRLAVVEGEEEITYYTLRARVAHLVEAIRSGPVVPGDRALIFSQPSAFAYSAYLAAMEAGCVAVPLEAGAPDVLLDAQIAHVAPRFALVHEDQAVRFAGLGSTRHVEHVIVGPAPLRTSHVAGSFAKEHDPEDLIGVAALFFTPAESASAPPRAVRVGHQDLIANTEALALALSMRAGERTVVVLPPGRSFGASIVHTHFWVGGAIHVGPKQMSTTTLRGALEASRATGIWGESETFEALFAGGDFGARELPHLRYLAQTGGALSPSLVGALDAGHVSEVYALYGQPEATACLSVMPIHDHPEKRGSIGRGMVDTTLAVVDADGESVKPGDEGEIVAHGPAITRGYLDDLEASATHFRDAGLRTGDRATVDEEGFVYVRQLRYGASGATG